jgi:outer membrane protein with beta-barrel domain
LNHRVLSLLVILGFTIVTASAQDTAPHSNFRRFNFDVGGGIGIGKGDVGRFVGASYNGVAGGGINFNRLFGVNAEYMYYGLPFKDSVIRNQFLLPGAGGNVHAVSLNGIVNAPLSGRWGAYGIFGIGFYRRSVSNHSETVLSGTPCQPAWRWWDLTCVNGFISPTQTIASNSKDAGGFNYGGGITYRLNHFHRAKLYVEMRYHRAYHSDGQTIFFPVTAGLRW